MLVFPPVFDQARFDLYNYDAVIVPIHFKCVFAKSNLFFFAKGEMMPSHFHGKIRAVIAAEEFIEFGTAAIKLLVWRFYVDRVFAKTIRGFPGTARDLLSKSGRYVRVPFVPAIGNGLHQLVEFISRDFHGLRAT
jgi:hypothetical protein